MHNMILRIRPRIIGNTIESRTMFLPPREGTMRNMPFPGRMEQLWLFICVQRHLIYTQLLSMVFIGPIYSSGQSFIQKQIGRVEGIHVQDPLIPGPALENSAVSSSSRQPSGSQAADNSSYMQPMDCASAIDSPQ